MKKILLVSIGAVALVTLSGCVVGPARHHSVGVGVGVSPVYVESVYREPTYYRPPAVHRVLIKQPNRGGHWRNQHRGDWGHGRGGHRGHR